MFEPIPVRLAPYEIALVFDVAGRRVSHSLRDGRQDRDAAAQIPPDLAAVRGHLNGAGGECAAAKALGIYWPGSVDTFHGPDLGTDVQVRTRAGAHDDLCLRPDDNGAHRYVLVTGALPVYAVVGWYWGADGKQARWAGRSGNGHVFYVPQGELHPFPVQVAHA